MFRYLMFFMSYIWGDGIDNNMGAIFIETLQFATKIDTRSIQYMQYSTQDMQMNEYDVY